MQVSKRHKQARDHMAIVGEDRDDIQIDERCQQDRGHMESVRVEGRQDSPF